MTSEFTLSASSELAPLMTSEPAPSTTFELVPLTISLLWLSEHVPILVETPRLVVISTELC
ncbi:hypothetical protein TorRG33x02_003060 [Trema orientale]|uniref:Uncharacterized protein n=1 Tax=Trema orientale TaxID=63057 RepID=A0A2P5G1V0_TREOI|nr:hypothetical protein TorRG33x02_003060 [Trema orientale]